MTATVAITGVGVVSPLGVGARSLHERWTAGECGLTDGVGVCTDFDANDWLTVKEQRRTPRFGQLALAACAEAFEQSGWSDGIPYDPERVGCVIGTGIGPEATIESQHDSFRDGRRLEPMQMATAMGNAATKNIQLRYGLKGESCGVVGACASGAQAIGQAIRMIRSGEVDAVVAGGAESPITPMIRTALGLIGATSKTGLSRPFDRRRDGFVLAEGAGVLILERPDGARGRSAPTLASVIGYGGSSDAYHVTAPPPDGSGAIAALRRALADAEISPREVQYVNAHGTSTPLNDRVETLALKAVFGAAAYDIPVSSTKSAVGHLIGAAGAVEAIASISALRAQVAPPTLGLEEPEEGLDLDYVPLRSRPLPERPNARGRVAISNCFGFGGHNSVLVIRDGDDGAGDET